MDYQLILDLVFTTALYSLFVGLTGYMFAAGFRLGLGWSFTEDMLVKINKNINNIMILKDQEINPEAYEEVEQEDNELSSTNKEETDEVS